VNIALGSDHAGRHLRLRVAQHLGTKGISINDLGVDSEESVHYPIFARKVCRALQKKESDLGILVCGSGQGMAMSANKQKGIRAALCMNENQAKLSREHNAANVLCLGERILEPDLALKVVDAFLESEFVGGRHTKRVELIESEES
jgi:ribose 5-phosphate isomerase B